MDITEQHIYQEHEQLKVGTQGTITTEDGREISFMMELEMEHSFELEESIQQTQSTRAVIDPLVINLQGGTAGLTNASFTFDLNADGQEEEISFVAQGSGFLALDVNGDGVINDGSELFGTQGTEGFSHLAQYDDDNNRWIDESDEVFSQLKVWTRDAEGRDQLVGLKEAGVGAIYLGSTEATFNLTDDENNLLGQVKRSGVFLTEDGQVASIQELDLAIHETAEASSPLPGEQSGSFAQNYQEALDALESLAPPPPSSGNLSVSEGMPSMLELLLPPDDEAQRVYYRTESVEVTESSFSQKSSRTAENQSTDDSPKRFFAMDSSRIDVMERLREKTEERMYSTSESDSYLLAIIETLKIQKEENRSNEA